MRFVDLTGQKFGKLTAVGCLGVVKQNRRWICECDCGDITTVSVGNLTKIPGTRSCGCENKYRKKDPGVAAKREILCRYKVSARDRGFEWTLTEEDFEKLTSLPCQYCGGLPATTFTTLSKNGSFTYNGIDRVNNSLGYISGNVVSCCSTCNRAKLMMSVDEFLAWARRVVQFNEVKYHGPD